MTANTIESATTTDAVTVTATNAAIMTVTATNAAIMTATATNTATATVIITRTAAQTSARLSAYIPTKFMTAAGIKTVQGIYLC